MRKSFNTTFILAGVLILVAAWYGFYEKKYKIQSSEKEENNKKLVRLESDQIQEMTVVRM